MGWGGGGRQGRGGGFEGGVKRLQNNANHYGERQPMAQNPPGVRGCDRGVLSFRLGFFLPLFFYFSFFFPPFFLFFSPSFFIFFTLLFFFNFFSFSPLFFLIFPFLIFFFFNFPF